MSWRACFAHGEFRREIVVFDWIGRLPLGEQKTFVKEKTIEANEAKLSFPRNDRAGKLARVENEKKSRLLIEKLYKIIRKTFYHD